MAQRVALIYLDGMVASELEYIEEIDRTLVRLNYEPLHLSLLPPLEHTATQLAEINADIIFNLFEGFDGCPDSEAAVARILEKLNLCFTGSSSQSLYFCQSKAATKTILQKHRIPTPDWQVLVPAHKNAFNLDFPCIVKPTTEHGSCGISENSVVGDREALARQIEYIWQTYHSASLVEPFLPGREFRVFALGNHNPRILPIEEMIYQLPDDRPELLTYAAKWIPQDVYFVGTKEKCPADITAEMRRTIEKLALRSFQALECRGYASVDLRQDREGNIKVIDVNPNTDISAMGSVKFPLEASGISYLSFINEILTLAKMAAPHKNYFNSTEDNPATNLCSGMQDMVLLGNG